MRKTAVSVLLVSIAMSISATAGFPGGNMTDESNSKSGSGDPGAILEEMSWLAGRWEGEAFGGRCEEIWAPPSAGSMVGLFKVWKNDRVSFYEIETITVDSAGLALNVKHFNADLTGWEEKEEVVRFAYVSAEKEKIKFKGITYQKISPDTLQILLFSRDKDGNISEIEINCKRADR